MSSRPPRSTNRGVPQAAEPEEVYPRVPEPKQNHTGSLLAFVSVLAVLVFGAWTAVTTLTGSNDKSGPKPTPTTVAAPAATVAPTAAPAVSGTAVAGAPSGTPTGSATPAPGSGRVHVVGQGDTLSKIAGQYSTTVDAILAANGIDRNKVLHVGDRLTIP